VRPFPFGVEDLIAWPQARAWIAVTVEAEPHRETLRLIAERHTPGIVMTAGAADTLGDVYAVIEVHVIWQVVDPIPSDWRVARLRVPCEWQHRHPSDRLAL
jgi:hypothetical protein